MKQTTSHFKSILLSLILVFTSTANVYALSFELEGLREFNFGQSMGSAREALKKRCSGDYRESDSGDGGEDCGTWLGFKVSQLSLGFSKKSFFSRRTLDMITVKIEFSKKAENTILSLLRKNFKESPERYDCKSHDYTMDNKPWVESYCLRVFDDNTVWYFDKQVKFHSNYRHFIEVRFHSKSFLKIFSS